MTEVTAAITMLPDGFITGPNDGPGRGLGDGGERLHYWVFGGPWTYDDGARSEPTGADKKNLESALAIGGAIIAGRRTYDAVAGWGGKNPWDVPLFVLTHHPEDGRSDGLAP